MSKTFEYNAWDGSYHMLEDGPNGELMITQMQDIEPAIQWAKKQRNSGQNDLGGARDKGDLKHYATVSMGAILEMRKHGIDFWNRDHEKDMLKWIEKNQPANKVTNRRIV